MRLYRLHHPTLNITPILFGALSLIVFGVGVFVWTQMQPPVVSDAALRERMAAADVRPIDLNLPTNQAQIDLGQALFFDKALSGDQDISCATCHHPTLASADNRPLSVGTGGTGLGTDRVLGDERTDIPRNAPEIFNRGSAAWRTMFWDGRVGLENYVVDSPAEHNLPTDLDNPLAVQAMFPVLSQDEMRGGFDVDEAQFDFDTPGRVDGINPVVEWEKLVARLLTYDDYQTQFAAVYPEAETFDITHIANAIAAFEVAAFSFDDSPYDRYVAGDDDALTERQKAGAMLFFGEAGCSQCHNGALLTDQDFYNIGVPQFGVGKANPAGWDFGRFLETDDPADYFAFRTPPLRNIALTAPYMHNGAFASLEDAVRHHLDVTASLENYDVGQLPRHLRDTVKLHPRTLEPLLATLDPRFETPTPLTGAEVRQLIAFLGALSSPSAENLDHLIPTTVPSGLPIED